LAELIDVGRSQRLHDQPALVVIDFDVVAHLIPQRSRAATDRCQLTAKELLPIFKQCQKNQLLPISVSNNLADTLLLPRSWANNYIDSDVFFEFLYTNKK